MAADYRVVNEWDMTSEEDCPRYWVEIWVANALEVLEVRLQSTLEVIDWARSIAHEREASGLVVRLVVDREPEDERGVVGFLCHREVFDTTQILRKVQETIIAPSVLQTDS